MDCAQDTAAQMDKAVKDILDQCYRQAVEIIKANRDDMDKVVAYLLEKETITGAEMVAIIEGRDPALVDDPYASTQTVTRSGDIEPPARSIHMTSEPIPMPPAPPEETDRPEEPAPEAAPSGPKEPAEPENSAQPEEPADGGDSKTEQPE